MRNIEKKLGQIFNLILKEAKNNKEFAEKLALILFKDEETANNSTSKRKARKRNPATFNPLTILEEQGEGELFQRLNQLEVTQLKDIISEFGMDPGKKTSRWRKKEKLVTHIFEVTMNRVKKGEVFRKLN